MICFVEAFRLPCFARQIHDFFFIEAYTNLSNVEIKFLLPNTSFTQKMDQEILKATKLNLEIGG
jgi:hypothetical protein